MQLHWYKEPYISMIYFAVPNHSKIYQDKLFYCGISLSTASVFCCVNDASIVKMRKLWSVDKTSAVIIEVSVGAEIIIPQDKLKKLTWTMWFMRLQFLNWTGIQANIKKTQIRHFEKLTHLSVERNSKHAKEVESAQRAECSSLISPKWWLHVVQYSYF